MPLLRSAASLCLTVVAALAGAQAPQFPAPGPKPTVAPIPLPPPNPKNPPQLTAQDLTAFLDGFLPLQLQRDDVAGATISVYQNGQPLILKGYGYADFKKKTPVDPVVTTFRPGSISKLFTYVSMMQLVEQGKLNLDTNIQQYLDFRINPGPRGIGDAPITLRNLATHTAALRRSCTTSARINPANCHSTSARFSSATSHTASPLPARRSHTRTTASRSSATSCSASPESPSLPTCSITSSRRSA